LRTPAAAIFLQLWLGSALSAAMLLSVPKPSKPALRLEAANLAVVVNTADPLSVAIGAYYAAKRHIPKSNVVNVRFDNRRDELRVPEFTALKAQIDRKLSPRVQAYALTWARPYRVGCMSITAAFALGTDAKYCASGCEPTEPSPYFNSPTRRPYDDLNIRLAMSLAALDIEKAKALIDRGVEADGAAPKGTAYLVSNGDVARNVRAAQYPQPRS
jgi:uncharacterized protein (TIGR03790 family)